MLKLVFAEAGPGPTLEVGPFDRVRIDGETLYAGATVVARHRMHSWEVRGRSFFRVDCESPVRLHFEDGKGEASPSYGPFVHFSCADGIAYGDGTICANVDLETGRWYCHRDSRHWREMVVTSAAAPAA